MGKRIFLFLAVNFLVIITISIIMSLLGLEPTLTRHGINYESLMVFCLLWGMGGAFISLALSRWMAKKMMGVRVVDPNSRDPQTQELVQMVHQLARQANLPKMPEVGIYDSPEVNAFATGPSRSKALVAVSTGILQKMDRDELEGVLGHEISHVANGDMVTMTLIQGVVNAFVMFLARVVAFFVMQAMRGDDDEGGFSYIAYFLTVIVLEMIFMIFGSMVVAWFSRYREFRADAGGAKLAGQDKMVGALQSLQKNIENAAAESDRQQQAFNSLKISTKGKRSSLAKLFASHPPLETRIHRLQNFRA